MRGSCSAAATFDDASERRFSRREPGVIQSILDRLTEGRLMRRAVIMIGLFVAACDSGPEWVNEQAELANELNPPPPPTEQTNVIASDTDYLNTAEPGNDINAVAPLENEAVPPTEGD